MKKILLLILITLYNYGYAQHNSQPKKKVTKVVESKEERLLKTLSTQEYWDYYERYFPIKSVEEYIKDKKCNSCSNKPTKYATEKGCDYPCDGCVVCWVKYSDGSTSEISFEQYCKITVK